MAKSEEWHAKLSRRERQIMNVLYEIGEGTVAEVIERLVDPPSYSAVRAQLRILEDKGHVLHKEAGPRYVFHPTVSRERARESAMRQVLRTFFDGSAEQAVAALLDMSGEGMSEDELNRLAGLIEQAKREGR